MSGEKEKCFRYEHAFENAGFKVSFDDHDSADALCLCGGGDLSPCLYGQPNFGSVEIDLERDMREMFYLRKFLDKNLPIFAVCRGLQLVNVYFGGTLVQNVCGHSQVNGEDSFHRVRLFGKLKEAYGTHAVVNSAHHQCVGVPGERLRVTALSDDGVIEGMAFKNLVAFQFHPERLSDKAVRSEIFSSFYADNFGKPVF